MKKSNSIFFVTLILCLYVISNNNIAFAESIHSDNNCNHVANMSMASNLSKLIDNSIKDTSNDSAVDVFSYATQQFNLTNDDIELMAKLVAAESIGEPYTGKVAVASVVLNRVSNPKFPNSIREVIFQRNAFSCVHNNTIISSPNNDCYKAVYEAINGSDPTNKALFFYNPAIATCSWMKQTNKINQLRIGHHTFFKIE